MPFFKFRERRRRELFRSPKQAQICVCAIVSMLRK
jgi:hypothetical protein